MGAAVVCPTEPGSQFPHAQTFQLCNSVFKSVIFEVKPLTDTHGRSIFGKVTGHTFRAAIFAIQAHVKVSIVRRAFAFSMPRRRWPSSGQVEQAVPIHVIKSRQE